jgi:hypothetical protein
MKFIKLYEEFLLNEASSPFDVRWDAVKGRANVQPSTITPNRTFAEPPTPGTPAPGFDEYWENMKNFVAKGNPHAWQPDSSTGKSYMNALFQFNSEKFPELISWSLDGKTYQMRTASGDIAEFVAKQNAATRNVILYRILDRNGNEILTPSQIMNVAQMSGIRLGDPANQAISAANGDSSLADYFSSKRISPADFQKMLFDYERPLKKSLNIELRGLKKFLSKI